MKQFMLLLLMVASLSYATTKSYDVVPYKNYIAVETLGTRGVTQYVRNTLDSLTCISFWVGDTVDTSSFKVEVRDSVSGALLAQTYAGGVQAPGSWSWMPCSLVTTNGKRPVRGRTYRVTVTRPSGAAISFAYDPNNPYQYGHMSVRGANPQFDTLNSDLALRVIGLRDTVGPDWLSVQIHSFGETGTLL
jgi:hypothetical protein